MSDKQFERDIKGKLGDYHSPIDAEALWGDLELEDNKKERGFFWWFFGCASILAILGGGYLLLANNQINTNNKALSAEITELKKSKSNATEANSNIDKKESDVIELDEKQIPTNTKSTPTDNNVLDENSIQNNADKNSTLKQTAQAKFLKNNRAAKEIINDKPSIKPNVISHSAAAAKNKTIIKNTTAPVSTPQAVYKNPSVTYATSTNVTQAKNTIANPLMDVLDRLPLNLRALDYEPATFKMSKRKAMSLITPLKPKGKLELMLNFNPYYAHKRLSVDGDLGNQLKRLNSVTESYQNAYSVGIGLRKTLSSGFRITAGVAFDQLTEVFKETIDMGISTAYDSNAVNQIIISDTARDTSFGAFKTYQTTSYQEIYNRYKSISIPISIGYIKRKESWSYYGDIGLIYNITKWQRGQSYTFGDPELRLENFEKEIHHINSRTKTGFQLSAGFGIGKEINSKWRFEFGPHIQHGINSWTDGVPLDIRYTNFGINTSVNFTF